MNPTDQHDDDSTIAAHFDWKSITERYKLLDAHQLTLAIEFISNSGLMPDFVAHAAMRLEAHQEEVSDDARHAERQG